MSAKTFIPVSRPYLSGNELSYVQAAVRTGWISSAGEYINAFEEKFARYVDCSHGVACSNGTAAVYLALKAAGIGPGDRVVTSAFTMMASVFPIVMLGAEPVLVDADPETWNMDTGRLSEVTGPIKAVLIVHIYGHPVDMDPVVDFAKSRNALVIEDAAEAHGALYKRKKVGSLSDVAAWSFYSNKVITCGEGGMITTNDPSIMERAKYYRNLSFDPNPENRFIHQEIGFNYRMTNLQAAIGLAQTENAEQLVEMRRAMAKKYLSRLSGLEDLIQLPVEKSWAKNVYWMFGIVLKDRSRLDAKSVMSSLQQKGVDTRRFFCPAQLQPCFPELAKYKLPVSEMLWERGFYLPSPADLTDAEADYVVDSLKSTLLGAKHVN